MAQISQSFSNRWLSQSSAPAGDIVRYALFVVLLPALVMAQEAPPVPNGHALFQLSPNEFQMYVSGIYEGHLVLALALKVPQIICVDPMLTRMDLARIVLDRISGLSDKMMRLPARSVVFRVLIEKLPCPGVTWEHSEPAY